MAKIKKLGIFDIVNVQKMISMLSENEPPSFTKFVALFPFSLIQNFLPIKLRKLPEAFVSTENRQINGMISVQAERGNAYKWNINQLFLDKNSYPAGRQLVDYILAKYGAMGANTFSVVVDDSHIELIDLFSKGCGFRLCSHESFWKMNEIKLKEPVEGTDIYRPFKNCDAAGVCELYNDSIYPHFRYSLSRAKAEFYDRFVQGFSSTSFFKYVLEDSNNKRIKAYIEIQTSDNLNYVLDMIVHQAYEDIYADVLNFAISQILRRKKDFNLFIKSRKYIMSSKKLEEYLKEASFAMVKTRLVLVKDFFKTIKIEEKIAKPAIIFSEIKGKPAFKTSSDKSL